MAFKSIIDIDVQDEKFKDFLEAFKRYKEKAEKAPRDWHKVAQAISGSTDEMQRFGRHQRDALGGAEKGAKKLGESLKGVTGHQKSFSQGFRKGSSDLKAFTLDTAAASLGLRAMATPIGFVVGGITAIGAAAAKATMALDRLTASKFKSATELGMTIAQQQAFNNYGSQLFSNPDATLTAIRNAKMSPAESQPLISLGIGSQAIANDSTAQLAFLVAEKAHALLKNTAPNVRGAVWESYTGGKLGGLGQAELFGTSMAQIRAYRHGYNKHKHAFAISPMAAQRAVNVTQAAGELKGRVETDVENAAASKLWTGFSMGAIRDARAAIGGVGDLATATEHAAVVISKAAARIGRAVGILPSKKTSFFMRPWYEQIHNPMDIEATKGEPSYYNKGNGHNFVVFGSNAQSYRAAAHAVRGYGRHTLAGIAMDYVNGNHLTPAQQRQFAASKGFKDYVHNASVASGLNPNQPLNLNSSHTMAEVLTGIRIAEQPTTKTSQQMYDTIYKAITDGMRSVQIHILNKAGPGSRVAVGIHAAAH